MEINSFKDLGDYLFVSGREINGNIVVGSIYFKNGRIRLVHENCPRIQGCDLSVYFIRLNYRGKSVEYKIGTSYDNRKTIKNNIESTILYKDLLGGTFFEYIKNNEKEHKHTSRGIPLFVDISAQNLKSIYDIVSICKSKANYFVYNEVAKLNLDFGIYDPKRL